MIEMIYGGIDECTYDDNEIMIEGKIRSRLTANMENVEHVMWVSGWLDPCIDNLQFSQIQN